MINDSLVRAAAEPGGDPARLQYRWGPRPALDGVRAIAVYLVVLFHGGIATFEGGFIGVDLFFTLSGFLVTNMMLVDIATHGRLRMARFYARRFRRLLPAAAVTVVGVAVLALLVLTPLERVALVADARAALLYYANWHFIGSATDYFAEGAAASPYLHFWSLSIEEQFYFVFPWIVVGLTALRRRLRRPSVLLAGIVALGLVSLAVQVYLGTRHPVRAYYGTDARLYQMFAGAALAVAFQQWGTPRRLAGLARIVAPLAIVAFTLAATSAVDVSPSLRGILAMALSVVTLAALEVNVSSSAARVLSWPTMTYLGRISYGTYLWHWPVVVLARRVGDFGAWELALISGVLGTALAALSSELLEMPVRRSGPLDRFNRTVVAVGLTTGLVIAVLAVPAILASRHDPAVAIDRGENAPPVVQTDETVDFGAVPDDFDFAAAAAEPEDVVGCTDAPPQECIVVEGAGAHVHLLGDSHSRMLLPTFERIAQEHGLTLSASYVLGCPWQDGLMLTNKDADGIARCNEFRDDQYNRVIPELDPDLVVVVSAPRDDPNGVPRNEQQIGGTEAIRTGTAAAVDQLAQDGRRVLMFEPIPFSPFNPLECLSAADEAVECAFQASAGPLPTEVIYRYEAMTDDAVFSADLDPFVCPHLPVCATMIDGKVIYKDSSHISREYALEITDQVYKAMRDAGAFEGLDTD